MKKKPKITKTVTEEVADNNDLINGSSTIYHATTDGSGTLTFTGILNG